MTPLQIIAQAIAQGWDAPTTLEALWSAGYDIRKRGTMVAPAGLDTDGLTVWLETEKRTALREWGC